MKKLFIMFLSGTLFCAPVRAEKASPSRSFDPSAPEAAPLVLRFEIKRYILEGATLLSQEDVAAAVFPYVGKNKDFSDVQRALEAVEDAYAKRGFSAARVLLPEQELEQGTIRFRVVESRFAKVEIRDNRYFSKTNVLNALPSVRVGGVPRSAQIARDLKLANENPARQLNVVLKAGEKEEDVDANVMVTDSRPTSWGLSLDNSGTPETGTTRLGISYRNANAFDADQVANIQYLMSPQHPDRSKVIGGSYKMPLYTEGILDSVEFFAGYSNVNALVGGLTNFQGGGLLFSARYNYGLDRVGIFDPRLSFGIDWRKFQRLEMTDTSLVLYNQIAVMPLSLTYAAQGKFDRSDLSFNVSYAANVPKIAGGRSADFAAYDRLNFTQPKPAYKVLRYGMSYVRQVSDWQVRTVLNGQWTRDVLVQGEQIRLGGADAVRGFSEGSEGGEVGARLNLEGYSPDFGKGDFRARMLIFYDAGQARPVNGVKNSIAGAGIGLRITYAEKLSMRVDRAQIRKAGTDTTQNVGDWRLHAALNAAF